MNEAVEEMEEELKETTQGKKWREQGACRHRNVLKSGRHRLLHVCHDYAGKSGRRTACE